MQHALRVRSFVLGWLLYERGLHTVCLDALRQFCDLLLARAREPSYVVPTPATKPNSIESQVSGGNNSLLVSCLGFSSSQAYKAFLDSKG